MEYIFKDEKIIKEISDNKKLKLSLVVLCLKRKVKLVNEENKAPTRRNH
jgi:hypothetical protein